MTDKFLKAKHWQLFVLTFGIPLVFQLFMIGSVISDIAVHDNPDPAMMFKFMKFLPVIMILYLVVFFGWHWSVAIGLQNKVPENVTMKVKKFKVFFFIPLVYLIIFLMVFSVSMNGLFNLNQEPDFGFFGGLFAVIVPLHFFAMYCIFYSLYFVAKTFKTVELQREVKFGDFAGEFFMIWFYPIGIWIIQPKINKMVEE